MARDQSQGSQRPATERADELLHRAGWVAGMVGSMVGMRLARIAAFAREEAEDLWAEAQSMRRQDDGDLGPAGRVPSTAREKAGETSEDLKRRAQPDDQTAAGVAPRGTEEPESAREQGAVTRGRITVDATNAIRQESVGPNAEAKTIDATPAARRHAEETGVDLRDVRGTGPGGRITVADVRKKISAKS